MMGGSQGMSRDMMGSNPNMMGGRDMMSNNRDLIRSQSESCRPGHDMMGMRNDGMMDSRDTFGNRDMMPQRSMGSGNGMMDMRENGFNNRDMMGGRGDMMAQRSMSVSNGSFGGMNGPNSAMGGNQSQGENGGFSRSMSYHDNLRQGGMTGSASPPGHGDGMKIGTWNDGRENNAGNSNFPSVSHFEI